MIFKERVAADPRLVVGRRRRRNRRRFIDASGMARLQNLGHEESQCGKKHNARNAAVGMDGRKTRRPGCDIGSGLSLLRMKNPRDRNHDAHRGKERRRLNQILLPLDAQDAAMPTRIKSHQRMNSLTTPAAACKRSPERPERRQTRKSRS